MPQNEFKLASHLRCNYHLLYYLKLLSQPFYFISTLLQSLYSGSFSMYRGKTTRGCQDSDRAAWPFCPGPLLLLLLRGVWHCGDRTAWGSWWGDRNLHEFSLKPKILHLFLILILFKPIQTNSNWFKLVQTVGSGQNLFELIGSGRNWVDPFRTGGIWPKPVRSGWIRLKLVWTN